MARGPTLPPNQRPLIDAHHSVQEFCKRDAMLFSREALLGNALIEHGTGHVVLGWMDERVISKERSD
jgi:hypothetical protein